MKIKKRDVVVIVLIPLISIILFWVGSATKTTGDTVYIYYNSKLYKTPPLSQNCEINVNDTNTVVIEDGYVFMKNATCPDKLCIKQGKVCDTSKNIVCLPNKVTVKVDKRSDIDTVAR